MLKKNTTQILLPTRFMETNTQPIPSLSNTLKLIQKISLTLTIIVVSIYVGYRLGSRQTTVAITAEKKLVVNTSPPPAREVDFALFWEVWNRLEQKYIDKSKLDSEKMVNGAISGMVASLGDPYTVFLPPKENSDFKQDLTGTFEGIGAQLGSKDDKIIVIAPLKDHPAELAGIKSGDWIIKVNGEETFGWTVPAAVTKIRGPKGSQVNLTVIHEGEQDQKEISVTRDTILVKSVEFEVKQKSNCVADCTKVAYLKLSRFGDQTNDEWNSAVSQIRKAEADKLIKGMVLDMRNNPGGYLQSAIYISSEFIKDGVVVKQENSDGTIETYSVTRVGNLLDIPLVILINKGSASASEIVAGALRDHKRGDLIGEKSFGKGSIQTPEDLPNGAGLHITTARWILPNGEKINGTGITPNIDIKSATDSAAADLQLDRAIDELEK